MQPTPANPYPSQTHAPQGNSQFRPIDYGNNVALDPEGSYRVWVHIGASALTGTDEPSSLDFTLDLGAADE